jgi:hypothetical protein
VRVVGGEHDPVGHAGELERRDELLGVIGLLDRLRGEPEVLAEDRRRLAVEVGDVVAQRRPRGVHRPHQRTRPRDTRLDEDDLERGEVLEDALGDEAGGQADHRVGVEDVGLQVVRRPARPAVLLEAAGVGGERQAGLGGGGVHGPVMAAAQRGLGGAGQQDLDEARVAGVALDLGDGQLRRLQRDVDRAAQALVAIEHLLAHPLVDGMAQRGGELGRLGAVAVAVQRDEDAVVDVVLFEQLHAHQLEVAAREAALRPRVDAIAGVAHARVDLRRVGHAHAVALEARAPRLVEPRGDVAGQRRRVDVGVDERDLARRRGGRRCARLRARRR